MHDTSGAAAANFQIPVALLEWDRERFGLKGYLDGSDPDFQLQNKLEVCLETRVDFMSRTTQYARDAAGRVTTRSYPDGSSVAFTYWADGKRFLFE